MTVKLERIKGELYFVSEWNEHAEPYRHVLKWKAEGHCFRVPDEALGKWYATRSFGANIEVSVDCGPHGRIEVWITGSGKAESVERIPVPQPKIRAGLRVRWRDGWQKETKREGWVAA
jgi:hypothetical protein